MRGDRKLNKSGYSFRHEMLSIYIRFHFGREESRILAHIKHGNSQIKMVLPALKYLIALLASFTSSLLTNS